jgi:crossover junction endodeoxyribonuclease RuvC
MARTTARQLWKAKLSGQLHPRKVDWETNVAASCAYGQRAPFSGILLGIDPSLRGTGLAVLACENGQYRLIRGVTVSLHAKASQATCLGAIHAAVANLCGEHGPAAVALEETIYVQNFKTAQIMGMARGAAIAAVAGAQLPVFEYAPLRIKQAVVGHGRASKAQVGGMVRQFLSLAEALPEDEADAAAVALCHGLTWRAAKTQPQ